MKKNFNKIGLIVLVIFCLILIAVNIQMAVQLVIQKNQIEHFKAQHIKLRERIIKLDKENGMLKKQVEKSTAEKQ